MTPEDVKLATTKLRYLEENRYSLDSVKASSLQVIFAGQYWTDNTDKEICDAARVGLLNVLNQRRAVLIHELESLGVEMKP